MAKTKDDQQSLYWNFYLLNLLVVVVVVVVVVVAETSEIFINV